MLTVLIAGAGAKTTKNKRAPLLRLAAATVVRLCSKSRGEPTHRPARPPHPPSRSGEIEWGLGSVRTPTKCGADVPTLVPSGARGADRLPTTTIRARQGPTENPNHRQHRQRAGIIHYPV